MVRRMMERVRVKWRKVQYDEEGTGQEKVSTTKRVLAKNRQASVVAHMN